MLPWLVVAAAHVLPMGYMGSYYAMLEGPYFICEDGRCTGLKPHYRLDRRPVESLLVVAHQVDKRIRPEAWDVDIVVQD